jgi:hypothetical protein
MAISTGKKIAKTGISRVPSPNPEKRVSPDEIRAARQMIGYSMMATPHFGLRNFIEPCAPVYTFLQHLMKWKLRTAAFLLENSALKNFRITKPYRQ